ncbi:high mobility group protein D-like [Drosophila rhopaloa]|uniref:HMG box domain-containing protein n=1 Tax=Drosophila rhopaloa TaxID=1041015 RepID=A0ABM5J3J2_DRORH|nr:high mobility group protein D-like [Drosophila rhopaloa]
MLWLNSARESIKRKNPGIKVTEVAKRGGEFWRAMKDKSEWEAKAAKAAKAKDDYDRAVKEFEANGGGGGAANGGAKKRAKPTKKPSKKSKMDESDEDDDDESE